MQDLIKYHNPLLSLWRTSHTILILNMSICQWAHFSCYLGAQIVHQWCILQWSMLLHQKATMRVSMGGRVHNHSEGGKAPPFIVIVVPTVLITPFLASGVMPTEPLLLIVLLFQFPIQVHEIQIGRAHV